MKYPSCIHGERAQCSSCLPLLLTPYNTFGLYLSALLHADQLNSENTELINITKKKIMFVLFLNFQFFSRFTIKNFLFYFQIV